MQEFTVGLDLATGQTTGDVPALLRALAEYTACDIVTADDGQAHEALLALAEFWASGELAVPASLVCGGLQCALQAASDNLPDTADDPALYAACAADVAALKLLLAPSPAPHGPENVVAYL